MMLVQGKWEVETVDDKNVLVSYQFLADPEGSLPSWIINMFLVDDPFKTMQNLREYVKAN